MNIKIIECTGKEFSSGKMEDYTLAITKMMRSMVMRGYTDSRMEKFCMEVGRKEICMVRGTL